MMRIKPARRASCSLFARESARKARSEAFGRKEPIKRRGITRDRFANGPKLPGRGHIKPARDEYLVAIFVTGLEHEIKIGVGLKSRFAGACRRVRDPVLIKRPILARTIGGALHAPDAFLGKMIARCD